jgi:hypothetical protein
MWIGCGRCSCAASILSTPSGSSSKPWVGRSPVSAHPLRPTAGPGNHRRAHPTPTGPPPRPGPAPSLGENSHQIRPAVPGPHPPGVSQHPTGNRHAGQRTETLTATPRPSTRITVTPNEPPNTTPAKPSKQTQWSRAERSKQLKTQAKTDHLIRRLIRGQQVVPFARARPDCARKCPPPGRNALWRTRPPLRGHCPLKWGPLRHPRPGEARSRRVKGDPPPNRRPNSRLPHP